MTSRGCLNFCILRAVRSPVASSVGPPSLVGIEIYRIGHDRPPLQESRQSSPASKNHQRAFKWQESSKRRSSNPSTLRLFEMTKDEKQTAEKNSKRALVRVISPGLVNLGNTCFANSTSLTKRHQLIPSR